MTAGGLSDRARLAAREAGRHIASAPGITAVAALHIGAALVVGALLFFVTGHASDALDDVAGDLTATIYLSPDVTPDAIEALRAAVTDKIGDGTVERATWFDADEEQARIIALLSADLLEGVDEAAIPSRAVIEARLAADSLDEARYDELAAWVVSLRAHPGVEAVAFAADHVSVLFALGDLVGLTGWLLAPLIILAGVFFLGLLVRRALASRAEELALMRMMGATEATIYAPFLVTGGLIGLAGGVLGMGMAVLIEGRLEALSRAAPTLGLDLGFAGGGLFVAFALCGVALGLLGAWASVQRDRHARAAR